MSPALWHRGIGRHLLTAAERRARALGAQTLHLAANDSARSRQDRTGALRGIRLLLVTQQNAWLHAVATVGVVTVSLLVGLSLTEWCWIVLAVMSVWTAEALNTAVEFLTDLASPTYHPLAGQAKDVAAGAVLVAATGAAIIGLLVLGPHVWGLANALA